MKTRRVSVPWILASAIPCVVAAFLWPTPASLAALILWWLACSLALGAQANLWIHDLTGGGRWGEVLRPYLAQVRSWWPVLSLALLAMPLFMPLLYPWAEPGWTSGAAKPTFQMSWFSPGFVFIRLLLYVLLLNSAMFLFPGWAQRRRATSERKHGLAAIGLLIWAMIASLLGVDLIMSLTPEWYSSGFGLIVLVAQLKLGLAWATMKAAPHASRAVRRDLGNLLLGYTLMWAYLAWVQFQIIWAENLPDEIGWYVLRLQTAWRYLALILVVFGLFIPLFLLLFRSVKQHPRRLQAVAALIAFMAVIETAWMVLPSVGSEAGSHDIGRTHEEKR